MFSLLQNSEYRSLLLTMIVVIVGVISMACERRELTQDPSMGMGTNDDGLEMICFVDDTEKLRIKGFQRNLSWKGESQFGTRNPKNRYHTLTFSLERFRDQNGHHWNMGWMSSEPEYLRVNNWLLSMKNGGVIDLSSPDFADQPSSVKGQWVDKYELSFRELLESRLGEDIATQLEDFLEREPKQISINIE